MTEIETDLTISQAARAWHCFYRRVHFHSPSFWLPTSGLTLTTKETPAHCRSSMNPLEDGYRPENHPILAGMMVGLFSPMLAHAAATSRETLELPEIVEDPSANDVQAVSRGSSSEIRFFFVRRLAPDRDARPGAAHFEPVASRKPGPHIERYTGGGLGREARSNRSANLAARDSASTVG